MDRDGTYTLRDVLSKGFEATCTAKDGVVYFWHRNFGVKIDTRTGRSTLLMDPATLPDAQWVATDVGAKELEASLTHLRH